MRDKIVALLETRQNRNAAVEIRKKCKSEGTGKELGIWERETSGL